MAGEDIGELERLEKDLIDNAAEFSYRQTVRLLRHYIARTWRDNGRDDPVVRVRPKLSLDTPGAEVDRVERLDDGYRVVTTFFGLYGAASPLPAFYTEELIEAEREDRTGARSMLDLVHERLYELHEGATAKNRPFEQAVEGGDASCDHALAGLVGLRDGSVRETLPSGRRMLRYVGLLARRQRSAIGLRSLLRDALAPIPVHIEECVERFVRVPDHARLALGRQNHELGGSALLGTRVRDRSGRFRLMVGPMDGQHFHGLVNDQDYWYWLVAMIGLYVDSPLQCELELVLEANAVGTTVLGDASLSRLGTTTWLLSESEVGLSALLQLT